jgi:hypothetical protein
MQISDDMLDAMIEAKRPDRIQGFHYPPKFVIRDVYLPADQQVIWEGPDSDNGGDEAAFHHQCERERQRLALAAALSVLARSKCLDWTTRSDGRLVARSPIGDYIVQKHEDGWRWTSDQYVFIGRPEPTAESAIASAQADYTRRTLGIEDVPVMEPAQ